MVDIPSFFDKIEFYGTLLPGYLVVTIYLLLYESNRILSATEAISFDLFSAIVFIVAGPALGLALAMFHRNLFTLKRFFQTTEGLKVRDDFLKNYAKVRIKLTPDEKFELDKTLADYDFSLSVGIGFLMLFLYDIYFFGNIRLIQLALVVPGIFFILGSQAERAESFTPMINLLIEKYENDPP